MESIEIFELLLEKLIDSEIKRKELGYKNKALNHMNQTLKSDVTCLKFDKENDC